MAAPPCIIDFAVQTRGTSTLKALDDWHGKAQGKTAIDYAFHMIVTDMPQERIAEMRSLADAGITSFKMFMAYPGAFLVDDGTIFQRHAQGRRGRHLICMHAENGIVIDELVKTRWRRRTYGAEVSRADAADARRKPKAFTARSRSPKWRIRPSISSTCAATTRSRIAACARPRRCRHLPRPVRNICSARYDATTSQVRRRQIRYHAAAARRVESGRAMERPALACARRHFDRPLSVLPQGAEGARQERLQQDPEWRPWRRESHEPDLSLRRQPGRTSRSTALSS